jgi:hypothetical protein
MDMPAHANEYYRTVQAAADSIGLPAGRRPEED